jgi:SEC-C motif-containing protein
MKISVNATCPCHSGTKYKKCCLPYHNGANPPNALLLMRSRYSAYALKNAKYIISTTHPNNPDFTDNTKQWMEDILEFCNNTVFIGLSIMEFCDGENEAFVIFKASLGDTQFVEKSRFLNENGKWLYESGKFE